MIEEVFPSVLPRNIRKSRNRIRKIQQALENKAYFSDLHGINILLSKGIIKAAEARKRKGYLERTKIHPSPAPLVDYQICKPKVEGDVRASRLNFQGIPVLQRIADAKANKQRQAIQLQKVMEKKIGVPAHAQHFWG